MCDATTGQGETVQGRCRGVSTEKVPTVHLVAVATDRTKYLGAYEESLARGAEGLNLNFTVLGEGQKWTGFQFKMERVVEFCKLVQRTGDPESYVVVTDAYDMFYNGGSRSTHEDLVRVYHEITGFDPTVLVVGAESVCFLNCFPGVYSVTSPQTTTDLYYPNGGFVMGRVDQVHRLYETLLEISSYDDQYGIGKIMSTDSMQMSIVLDFECRLVYNCSSHVLNNNWYEDGGRILFDDGVKMPFFIHCPANVFDNFKRYKTFATHLAPSTYVGPTGTDELCRHVIKYMFNPVFVQFWAPLVVALVLIIVIVVVTTVLWKKLRRCQEKKHADKP